MKPNRLTPFAVGGLIFGGVKAAGCCAGAGSVAAAGGCRVEAGVLLSAEVRGERAVSKASWASWCCLPDAEPVERRTPPPHSFSLS